MQASNKTVTGLTLIALIAMIAAYFSPIWWVSLTAPNYPKDAFPDGIRIHFHFDGVYNGCKAAGKGSRMANEIIEKDIDHTTERYNPILDAQQDVNKGAQGLDDVHEMNTTDHYVRMFPNPPARPADGVGVRHLESGVPAESRASLEAMGWTLGPPDGGFGGYQNIIRQINADGGWTYGAATEMRKDGLALAW